MQKDQRNLLASLALAGSVIAGIAGTATIASVDGLAFIKMNPQMFVTGPFDKWQPRAAAVDPYMKIDFS